MRLYLQHDGRLPGAIENLFESLQFEPEIDVRIGATRSKPIGEQVRRRGDPSDLAIETYLVGLRIYKPEAYQSVLKPIRSFHTHVTPRDGGEPILTVDRAEIVNGLNRGMIRKDLAAGAR